MSLRGVVLQFAYRVRRHLWLEWPLARWFGLLQVCLLLAMLVYSWPHLWVAGVAGGLLLGYMLVLGWAGRQGFVYFEPIPQAGALLQQVVSPPPPLRAEELVPVRASGMFTVEGRDQYYVDLEADFETVGTREHIILARVHPSRFLLLGTWPGFELGWWYIFFQPGMIREVDLGYLHFGSQPQLSLRVIYAPDDKTVQTVYLRSDDVSPMRQIWDDLLRDAPQGVAGTCIADMPE